MKSLLPSRSFATSSLIAVACALLPTLADAKEGDVVKRGRCAGGEKIKLKASPENGRIEVEYELDQARPGDRWRIVVKKNGRKIFRKVRRVNQLGNVEVRKLTGNGAGKETIRVRAKNLRTGEVCTLKLKVPF